MNDKDMRTATAKHLVGILADTYVLMNRTQLYHWNIEGKQFKGLHDLFETQYRELFEAVDDIAERVRTIGYYTPGTLGDFILASDMPRERVERDSRDILLHVIEGHQHLVHRLKVAIQHAESAIDAGTVDLLTQRLRTHEKATWMLRAQASITSEELASIPVQQLEAIAR